MSDEDKKELMMIISKFEGYLWGRKIHDEYINTQLDRAIALLQKENELPKTIED